MGRNIRRLIPFFVLIVLIAIVYLSNLHQELSLENIQRDQRWIESFVHDHPISSPLIYIGIYIVSVCLVIPDSTILTLLAGFIFPFPLAVLYAVFSETAGAVIFFWIFRGTFGESLIVRERPFLRKMRKGFKKNTISYLLFLRLSHIAPFWLTNIAAAYFKVKNSTFAWTTALGVLPLTYILADAGRGLSQFFAMGHTPKMSEIFDTQMKIALLFIGLLALIPIFFKKYRRKQRWKR